MAETERECAAQESGPNVQKPCSGQERRNAELLAEKLRQMGMNPDE